MRRFVKKGEIVAADSDYGLEHGFFGEMKQIGASHVILSTRRIVKITARRLVSIIPSEYSLNLVIEARLRW